MNKVFFILSIFICLSLISTQNPDYVNSLPDYPYNGTIFSGYLNTSEDNRQLHYVFVPSLNQTNKLVLWLNGGPGCSSMIGFLQEHGPAVVPDYTTKFELNPYSWTNLAHMIYIESPAGVGFSYSDKSREDIRSNDTKSGVDNLNAILSFFQKYPHLKELDFYISGESYAGIYVPTLAQLVLKHNLNREDKINLKGILIGNGVADWEVEIENSLIDYAYDHGLYSFETRTKLNQFCGNGSNWINEEKCIGARKEIQDSLQGMNIYDIYGICPPVTNRTKGARHSVETKFYKRIVNYQRKYGAIKHETFKPDSFGGIDDDDVQPIWPDGCAPDEYASKWLNREDVKKALHVRQNITFTECNDEVGANYTIDAKGSLYLYPQLIEQGLKIWFFSGDTDAAVSFNGSERWIQKLNLVVVDPWKNWSVNGQTAGYYQIYNGLTFLTIKGAGHMAPQWKRKESYALFKAFLEGRAHP